MIPRIAQTPVRAIRDLNLAMWCFLRTHTWALSGSRLTESLESKYVHDSTSPKMVENQSCMVPQELIGMAQRQTEHPVLGALQRTLLIPLLIPYKASMIACDPQGILISPRMVEDHSCMVLAQALRMAQQRTKHSVLGAMSSEAGDYIPPPVPQNEDVSKEAHQGQPEESRGDDMV